MREFDNGSKHFPFDDHLSNSHNLLYSLCNDIVGRKLMLVTQGGGGGSTSLFGLSTYVLLNRVWFSRSWVLNRVYNFTNKCLEQGVFLDWKPFKDLRWVIYICNTNIFFLNIYFHDFSVKKHLTLYVKQNKSGSESNVSYLKQGGKMSNFCLKQGHGLKASVAQLYPDFPWVPPPPFTLGVSQSWYWKGLRWAGIHQEIE